MSPCLLASCERFMSLFLLCSERRLGHHNKSLNGRPSGVVFAVINFFYVGVKVSWSDQLPSPNVSMTYERTKLRKEKKKERKTENSQKNIS